MSNISNNSRERAERIARLNDLALKATLPKRTGC